MKTWGCSFSCMLWQLCTVMFLNIHSSPTDFGPFALASIIEGPKGGSFPKGSDIELKCIVSEQGIDILWLDKLKDTVIFINKVKNTEKEIFDNFHISEEDGDFSMTILNAQVSDDGYYSCKEGDASHNADVLIEEPPVLSIEITTKNSVRMESAGTVVPVFAGELIIILCKAENAKPAVQLQLKVDDGMLIQPINYTQENDNGFYETKASFSHVVEENDLQITCQAYGQISIPPVSVMRSLVVVYKPECSLRLRDIFVECTCDAVPPVIEYKISVDGELRSTQSSLSYEGHTPGNFTCVAKNAVGEGEMTFLYVPSSKKFPIYAVVVPFCVLVMIVTSGTALILWKCRGKNAREQVYVLCNPREHISRLLR